MPETNTKDNFLLQHYWEGEIRTSIHAAHETNAKDGIRADMRDELKAFDLICDAARAYWKIMEKN